MILMEISTGIPAEVLTENLAEILTVASGRPLEGILGVPGEVAIDDLRYDDREPPRQS